MKSAKPNNVIRHENSVDLFRDKDLSTDKDISLTDVVLDIDFFPPFRGAF